MIRTRAATRSRLQGARRFECGSDVQLKQRPQLIGRQGELLQQHAQQAERERLLLLPRSGSHRIRLDELLQHLAHSGEGLRDGVEPHPPHVAQGRTMHGVIVRLTRMMHLRHVLQL